jgi:hypothetical protein
MFAWGQDRAALADLLDRGIVWERKPGVFCYTNDSVCWFWRRMPGD